MFDHRHNDDWSAVKKGYDMSDIQVLAPMYKGSAGIKKLNTVLQSILNPKQKDSREIEFGDVIFRKGDKVLQLVNSYSQVAILYLLYEISHHQILFL